jgi:hypothetical protein
MAGAGKQRPSCLDGLGTEGKDGVENKAFILLRPSLTMERKRTLEREADSTVNAIIRSSMSAPRPEG